MGESKHHFFVADAGETALSVRVSVWCVLSSPSHLDVFEQQISDGEADKQYYGYQSDLLCIDADIFQAMAAHIPYGYHHANSENDSEGVSQEKFQGVHPHNARNEKYLRPYADEMSSQQDKGDTFFPVSFFKNRKLCRRQQPVKPSVTDNHAAIFSADGIKDKIGNEHPDVNGEQGGYGFDRSAANQEAAEDEGSVFGE